MSWTPAFDLAELAPGACRLVKQEGVQVAVFHLEDGSLHAIDNLCPHEGYPLVQGLVAGCTLTCAWHNWKFDLRDGANLKGGEDVRRFPLRVVQGRVELDLSRPDPAREQARLWASLEAALLDGDGGRASRETVRLLQAGVSPAALAAFVAAFDGDRAEYGASHVLALCADALRFLPEHPGPAAVIPLAQALGLAAETLARRPARALAPAHDPGEDPVRAGQELCRRVEAEDGAGAEALLRGALARGWGRTELQPWFFACNAAHFVSFGHRLIYQHKAFELLEAAGWDRAEPILCGLLSGMIQGTREDLLPAWAPWRTRLHALDLDALHRVAQDPSWQGQDELVQVLVSGRSGPALDAVVQAIAQGAPLPRIVDAISLAAAERLLRFQVAHDADPGVQDGWLSVTHTLTFAAALRASLPRWNDPRRIALVLQGARFVNHHKVLDGPRPALEPRLGGVEDLLRAIADRDAGLAIGIAAGRPPGMGAALKALCLTDLAGAGIVQAHLIKTTLVALDEAEATGDDRPVLAVVRLLASPVRQRWAHQGALEALAFVTEGKKPRVLAP